MTTPGDESRTELAWREIVAHYGERPVLDDEPSGETAGRSTDEHTDAPTSGPAGTTATTADLVGDLPDDLVDDDEVEVREQAVAASERFQPPPPPPLPRPRTWQRGVAWAGVFVSPLVALVVGLLSIYVTPLLGWALVAWFVGGFVYLVREMPRSPRDPWDDGSRV
ncbi:hypothetical protein F4692_004075 [Nocardioides cavernae]|uniref:Uncharacterized protein n=1 Tax=Nocardioides cavernae TaxID=1921566 RepID=A0A7Y9KTZ1_9ACTN|nr:hypothetical protein [Nocardioides cavernae]NYE38920.1 hypothetical protein [Nocardioides cavernae]